METLCPSTVNLKFPKNQKLLSHDSYYMLSVSPATDCQPAGWLAGWMDEAAAFLLSYLS